MFLLIELTEVQIRYGFILKDLVDFVDRSQKGKIFLSKNPVDCVDRSTDNIGFYNKSSC